MWGQMNDEAAVLRRALSESSKLGPCKITWSTRGGGHLYSAGSEV